MYTVTYKFERKGLEPVALTDVEPGQTVLELALVNNIELHHNCGGMCACSTCHVYMDEGDNFVEALSKREKDFINKAINPRLNSRLACQCILLQGSGKIVVTLPDQTRLPGE